MGPRSVSPGLSSTCSSDQCCEVLGTIDGASHDNASQTVTEEDNSAERTDSDVLQTVILRAARIPRSVSPGLSSTCSSDQCCEVLGTIDSASHDNASQTVTEEDNS